MGWLAKRYASRQADLICTTENSMGLIGKAIDGVASDVGHAVEGVAKGIGKVVDGGADLAEGALTLNPKQMETGAKNIVTGGIKTASDAVDLTPEELESSAANNLLDGALEECGIGGKEGSEDGGDNEGGISLEDLSKTKDLAEMMPEGMKPSFLKV